MRQKQEFLLGNNSRLVPPKGLYEAILFRVEIEQRRIARLRLAVFGTIALCSFLLFVPALAYVSGELSRSGFSQYFSLLFSDGGAMLSHWKEFALSLIESAPIFETTVFLAVVLTLLWSSWSALRNVRAASLSTQLFRYG